MQVKLQQCFKQMQSDAKRKTKKVSISFLLGHKYTYFYWSAAAEKQKCIYLMHSPNKLRLNTVRGFNSICVRASVRLFSAGLNSVQALSIKVSSPQTASQNRNNVKACRAESFTHLFSLIIRNLAHHKFNNKVKSKKAAFLTFVTFQFFNCSCCLEKR